MTCRFEFKALFFVKMLIDDELFCSETFDSFDNLPLELIKL